MPVDPFAWIDDEAAKRDRLGLTRSLSEHGPATPGRLLSGGQTLINFASNDYLGLASDPRVIEAACEAARRFGWGAGASALVCGWRQPHQELAEALAEFEQAEAVALFPTGYAANLGAIAAVVGPGDTVYADRLNHSCLVNGARLSGARLRVYPHNDADRLESLLARDRRDGGSKRILIATDGVLSMDGDLAPLRTLADLADRFGAMLLVDEAHGTGVFGPDGRGACSAFGVADRVPIRVGTLSKALGSIGGFVAGSRRLIDHLHHRAPTFVYSTALPPAAAASARAALAVIQGEPERRAHLLAISRELRESLPSTGSVIPPGEGPIVPILLGEPGRALDRSQRLKEAGFLVPAIRPPTVPHCTSRLRISLSAAHATEDVAALVQALDVASLGD
ncbi:8-amino-7-oxononanoate synthase [soil metagenome]